MEEFQVKILTDVTVEPVTLDEVKAFCRIDADFYDDDNTLNMLIVSERERLEKVLNLSFSPKELQVRTYTNEITLPYGPVTTITSIKDSDGGYITDYDSYGLDFPTLVFNPVSNLNFFYPLGGGAPIVDGVNTTTLKDIVYLCGYVDLPKALKNALLTQIDYAYKNIGNPNMESISPIAFKLSYQYSRNPIIQ